VEFLGIFSILLFVLLLHPVEVPLLGGFHLQQVYTVLRLLHLFELGFIREHVKALDWVLSVGIAELESLHSRGFSDNADETLAAVRGDHFAFVVHATSLEFNQGGRAGKATGSA